MFKAFFLIKRKSVISFEQMKEHYESSHAPLGVRLIPGIRKYVRHYLQPYGSDEELPYDVVTEAWFDDREAFDQAMTVFAATPAIEEDGDRVFDTPAIRVVIVEDRESELSRR